MKCFDRRKQIKTEKNIEKNIHSSMGSLARRILGLSLAAMVVFTGCGSTNQVDVNNDHSEGIELIEPASVSISYVAAKTRTLYDYTAISAYVVPEITELSYDDAQSFAEYGKLPGDEVHAGDVIIYGNTESLEDQIKGLKENIADSDKAYNKELKKLNEDIDTNEADVREKQEALDKLYAGNPQLVDDGTFDALNRRHDSPDLMKLLGWHASAIASLDHLNQRKKELTQLYALDNGNRQNQLRHLNESVENAKLKATTDGVVMSVGYYGYASNTNWIGSRKAVAAVGDTSKLQLKCEYVGKSVVNSAEDVYAIVNGERYEVEYQPLDTEEYERLEEQNGVVYATFNLIDPLGKVSVGDYAVIMIVKHRKQDVLAIPTNAITYENGVASVTVLNENEKNITTVKCGVKDGNYTEILSGLNDGDKILCEQSEITGNNSENLTKGGVSNTFTGNGYILYPSEVNLENPVKHGVTYLDEMCVTRYQQVEKGEVIAKIHVLADEVEIARQERRLSREQARLNDLIKDGELKNEEAIEMKREVIADISESLADMKTDRDLTEIVAPFAGVITELNENLEPGDIIGIGSGIGYIADVSSSYIVVDDPDNLLNYGNDATISINANGKKMSTEGQVVTVNAIAIGKDLRESRSGIIQYLTWNQGSGSALVRLPEEDVAAIAGSSNGENGWWRTRFSVSVKTRQMDNVVLVPKKAVKEISGSRYVKVMQEDGSLDYVSFISGGADGNNYWVAEGLDEGMKICFD